MRSLKNLLFLSLLSIFSLSLFSQSISPKYQGYHLPNGLTQDDYSPGVVIFKVKPEYRPYCQPSQVTVPILDRVLNHLQVHTVQKTIANAQPPSEQLNALGQEMVDLSLIYEAWFDPSTDIEYAVNMVLSSDAVEYAEPLYAYPSLYDPDDPDTLDQYYLSLMQIREAWDVSKGDSSIAIGIIDTGTSFSHDEIENKVWYNPNDTVDGIDNDNNGFIDDYRGWDFGGALVVGTVPVTDNNPTYVSADHGVLVAGAAVAEPDNGNCIAAVGFNTSYVPIKVSSDGGDVIVKGYHGIIYGADLGLPIMNCSWGGTGFSHFGQDATDYAVVNKGSAIFAACGNTPTNVVFYPASYSNVISVGGTQGSDDVWLSDPTFGTSYSYLVDVCAPARNIKVPARNSTCWGGATGTSMASPIAAGVAGLVKAEFPSYTNMQVAQRVRVTCDDLYSNWPNAYQQRMGRGRVNALRALTDTSPSVRVLDVDFVDLDGNGKIQPGDTVEIYAEFVNYLDRVENLEVTLTSPSNAVTVLSTANSYVVGDLDMMETSGTCLAPFRIVISPAAASDSRIYVKFNFDGTNYDDQEYWERTIHPSYIDLHSNLVETSMNSRGNFGYTDFPISPKGRGFKYDGDLNYLGEGGFMIGTSATQVSDVVRNQNSVQDGDFQGQQAVYKLAPGPYGDEEGHALFNDNGAGGNALGVTVRKHAYQFAEAPDEDYVIFEYVITNDNANPIVDAYAGVFADWEVGWWVVNRSQYWAADRMITVFDDAVGTPFYYSGMSLITSDSLHAYSAHESSFGFTTADKWHALTQVPDSAQSDTADIFQVISAGPFTIAPGDSHIVAFALFGGTTVPAMQTTAAAAKQKYNCLIRGGTMPTVALGPDVIDCDAPSSYTLDAGAGYASYLWNTGDSTQTISVNSSGEYHVRVSDGNGCWDWDVVDVVIDSGVTASMTVSATSIFSGDTVAFADNSTGATKYYWDFGDGTAGSIQPSVDHVYNGYGTYTAMHIASNGTCSDTVVQAVSVDTITSLDPVLANGNLMVYPNPAKDKVNVTLTSGYTGSVEFSLHTLLGREVRSLEAQKTNATFTRTLNLNGLPAGVYLAKVRFGDTERTFKVMLTAQRVK